MRVADVMTKNPRCCGRDTSLEEVARIMVENDCGEVPVIDKRTGRPLGVITDRDITCRVVAAGHNPLQMKAADCMSQPIVTVGQDVDVGECCKQMETNQIRRIPVVDEKGRCCGIVSQADIAKKLDDRKAGEVVRDISRPSSHASATAYH